MLALAREDLACYATVQHPPFEFAKHLQVVTDLLERIERGDVSRLILSVPPRHGKSLLSSTFFPAWYLGRNPNRQVITASYGQDLAEDFGRQVRNLMGSPLHVAIFPECRLSENSAAAHRFSRALAASTLRSGAAERSRDVVPICYSSMLLAHVARAGGVFRAKAEGGGIREGVQATRHPHRGQGFGAEPYALM
ncbi:MAG: hypothetical protein M3547_03505 [Acidobacteriota bacterium]|nr:hypothetical protein [Acidobacteriota bacterium]